MTTVRAAAWRLFDEIVRAAPAATSHPWRADETGVASFDPDYDTLRRLLAVPAALEATSQSGVPALALDVWLSFELRRAGFETDQVWPRPTAPRVLSWEVQRFVAALPERLREEVQPYVQRGPGGGRAAANILVPEVMASAPDATSEEDPAGPLDPGPADEADAADEQRPEEAITPPASLAQVTLHRGTVPGGLDPGCFLATMCNLVLDRTPINLHAEARARRRSALV